ncbi:hypothetical protein CC1G_07300 [Coprinopsis cinerea okayama7|uniref:Uncharacterized protein n=1 Tax=Coprinopsis cinerea (strain Okayama-7 / 130 / ATCC MYA-4618 / FGSC 9003) TaxID=240176 RepID=A8NNN0_COPC7|nr:hypothetical protein CC1G_07300 [Coprinopsis cinerea okayama7\|eukprot:XP_001835158.2 hypothetical protein CC1G_07300 [Coprinopsis cinerea okayama7\
MAEPARPADAAAAESGHNRPYPKVVLPMNVTHGVTEGSKYVSIFMTFVGWGLAVATIGVTAYGFAEYKRIKNELRNLAPPPATIEVEAHNILASGIIILVFACLICIFLLSTFIWLIFNRAGRRARGFFTSGASLFIPAFVVFICSWLYFADLAAYTRFLASSRATVEIVVDGMAREADEELIDMLYVTLGISPYYNKWGFLRNIAIVGWIFWFFSLLTSIVLFMAASDGAEENDVLLDANPPEQDGAMRPATYGAPAPGAATATSAAVTEKPAESTAAVGQPAPAETSETAPALPSVPVDSSPLAAAPPGLEAAHSTGSHYPPESTTDETPAARQ